MELDPALSRLVADPDLLERILANLLDNCIRHSPEGGEIRIAFAALGRGHVRIVVTDQGPGIPEALRDRVFELFSQAPAADPAARTHENRGLGLAFCKVAAEAHGGRIWAEAPEEGGTRFVLELPTREDWSA